MNNELEELQKRIARVESYLNLPPISQSVTPIQKTSAQANFVTTPQKGNLETDIGRKLLPVLGIFAVIFGVSYFFKYAFEVGLITIVWRVIIGMIAGAILLGLGEFLRAKYPKYAWLLSGGGGAVWYISLYAAFSLYGLINQPTAFALMILVTLALSLLALHHRAEPLMAVAIIGGFLTPVILSSGFENQMTVFTYVALLNAGILFVALIRPWRWVYTLGLLATFFIILYWLNTFLLGDKILVTEVFFVIYFIEFLLCSLAHLVPSRELAERDDITFLVLNATMFYGGSYFLLRNNYHSYLGMFTLALASAYLVVWYFTTRIKPSDKFLSLAVGGITAVLLVLVPPLQFDGKTVSVLWSIEAIALLAFGFFYKQQVLRLAGIICFVLSVWHLLVFLSSWSGGAFTPIFNERFGVYLVAVLAGGVLSWFYFIKERTVEIDGQENMLAKMVGSVSVALLLIIFSLEVTTYFGTQIKALKNSNEYSNVHATIKFSIQKLSNQRNASLSVLWSLYAVVLLLVGIFKKIKLLRWEALVLFGITIIKIFIVDLRNLPTLYRFISTIVIGTLLLVGSYWYYRNQTKLE